MARPPAVAPLLLLLLGAAAAAAAAGDIRTANDITEDLLASAVKDAAKNWPTDALRLGQLPLPLAADWAPVAQLSGRLARPRRSPQDEQQQEQRQKRRRRKGGRRRGGRRRLRKGGRRRRPTTTAPEPRMAAVTEAATTTTTTATTTTTMVTTTTPPPRPNFNVAPEGTVNHRPVVGLLTQSLSANLSAVVADPELSSYIDASYVKFLEGAGARVVPVMVDQSNHYYREMFRYLNGLLLPGGSANLQGSGYAAAARALWKIANEYSDDHFPILGIGQGLEMLTNLAAQRSSFKSCPATNLASRLSIEPGGARSRLLGAAGDRVRDILSSQPSTVTFYGRCLSPSAFRSGMLSRDFSLVATSQDGAGRVFVSIIEHKRLPVFGLAFQPEKPQFEWSRAQTSTSIPHTADAILASQHIGNAFVAEVRKNRHRFPSVDLEEDYLIFNYEPEFTGIMGADVTSCYFFS